MNRVISPEQAISALVIDIGKEVDDLASIQWNEQKLVEHLQRCSSITDLPVILGVANFESSVPPQIDDSVLDELIKYKREHGIFISMTQIHFHLTHMRKIIRRVINFT